MKKYYVAPSLLAADKAKINEEIALVERLGAKYIHIDIMDGKFVPNLSFSVDFVKQISPIHHMINDVHIMIEEPLKRAEEYLTAGADILTFHYEACKDEKEVVNTINLIHKYRKKAGLSIKPNTSVSEIIKFVKDCDLLLVMSVEPGKGGQAFMPNSLEKIKTLRAYIDENKLNCLIEVDGGINNQTAPLVKESGVDILVAGSYLFGHDDIEERMRLVDGL